MSPNGNLPIFPSFGSMSEKMNQQIYEPNPCNNFYISQLCNFVYIFKNEITIAPILRFHQEQRGLNKLKDKRVYEKKIFTNWATINLLLFPGNKN